jgi:hypothetical protein
MENPLLAGELAVDTAYKGKGLQLAFTVEDEGVFMPWSATVTYRRAAGRWPEHVCAENLHGVYATEDLRRDRRRRISKWAIKIAVLRGIGRLPRRPIDAERRTDNDLVHGTGTADHRGRVAEQAPETGYGGRHRGPARTRPPAPRR